jgi:hypothetical protein
VREAATGRVTFIMVMRYHDDGSAKQRSVFLVGAAFGDFRFRGSTSA